MIERLDKGEKPVLKTFPSAQAQGGLAISGNATPARSYGNTSRTVSVIRALWRVLLALVVLFILGVAILFFALSRGPVSHEQLTTQVESQLSALLGEGQEAKIGAAKVAFGNRGLLALDASDVRVLKDNTTNLGVVNKLSIRLKALDLLQGKVTTESVAMDGASVSLLPYLPGFDPTAQKHWPKAIDFAASFMQLGSVFAELETALQRAGLEKISLTDAKLLGFESLGLRSPTGRLISLNVEKDKNFQIGTFFEGALETIGGNWEFSGAWRPFDNEPGAHVLSLRIAGLDVSDLVGVSDAVPESSWIAHGALTLEMSAPFHADLSPQQAVLQINVEGATLTANNESVYDLQRGQLNFRFLPEKNQIELERSPVVFKTTEASLIGGLRYPKTEEDALKNPPVFQIAANRLLAYGHVDSGARLTGAANLAGRLDTSQKQVIAEEIALFTPNGKMGGTGFVGLGGGEPHIRFALNIPNMPVVEFKQFWPSILAPRTRTWAQDGIREGAIKDAWVKGDFPPGLFGNDTAYQPENLSAQVPVFKTSVKSVGKLPRISQADGVIDFAGRETTVTVSSGEIGVGREKPLKVSDSSLLLGDYTDAIQKAKLDLSLSGEAAGLAALGTMQPLGFTQQLGLDPGSIGGGANAKVSASFNLREVETEGLSDWNAKVSLSGFRSSKPIEGRKLDSANLKIEASPKGANVSGTAKMDGVPVKLAMNGPLGGTEGMSRSATLTLSDADRKRLGADTGKVLTGPVSATVQSTKGGEKIEANLRNARLNFPWIGWAKGKGIPGKASFVLQQNKGVTTLKDLQLSGQGFSARGTLQFDKSGLLRADLKRVKLNKTDDIDVKVVRSKGGYKVTFAARAYDGRSLIQSVLKTQNGGGGDKTAVTVSGTVGRLIGFNGQSLSDVSVDFAQRNGRVTRAKVRGQAGRNGATSFSLAPVSGGMKTDLSTRNAGAVLQFLDLYTKVRGGQIVVSLVQDSRGVFRGPVKATGFQLLDEPRLAALLQKPKVDPQMNNRDEIERAIRRTPTDRVTVDQLQADVEKGRNFLNVRRGRLSGGDASAAFEGAIYDQRNRINIRGTYLPARSLNRLVSKIPILGLALGRGKVNGLLGITFRLTGPYGNPRIQVNPLSIIAPGVLRQIFKF